MLFAAALLLCGATFGARRERGTAPAAHVLRVGNAKRNDRCDSVLGEGSLGDRDFRVGFGYDIHRLVEGRGLVLGGVVIAFEKGLLGHSDADVLLHAICDAMLGGAALGDIGRLFPDTDPDLAGASSERFVRECLQRVEQAGFFVSNLDATIIAEAPRLTPHFAEIAEHLSRMLKVPIERISLKATTNEGLGLVGKGEAMAAMCVVGLGQGG